MPKPIDVPPGVARQMMIASIAGRLERDADPEANLRILGVLAAACGLVAYIDTEKIPGNPFLVVAKSETELDFPDLKEIPS